VPRARNSPASELPAGFHYHAGFLSVEEEAALIQTVEQLPFAAFDFHGYIAKRRIVEYGWEYDFGTRRASRAPELPDFLLPLRNRAADLAAIGATDLVEAVVTEYPPGAPIGWHRDVPQFETIIGISLLSSCRMRLKPYRAEGKVVSVILEPRSLYVISGVARWRYQHSIPAVENLRYSITFRTLRARQRVSPAA
jgi:alkylated DNA repair dioxygenase AlkB